MALHCPSSLSPHSSHCQRKRQNSQHLPYTARRLPSRISGLKQHPVRPVLAALNLRRLPSRALLDKDDDSMVTLAIPAVGSKRKRNTGANENAHTGGRPARGAGRLKRLRSASSQHDRYSSDETSSSMQVDDEPTKWVSSEESEPDQGEEENVLSEVEDQASDDEYMISSAPPSRLRRLLKPELVRLYTLAGLTDDPECLTKSELIDLLIDARDDIAELPPSSPTRGSECSSDDGHGADDGDEDRPIASTLRRRATYNGLLTAKSLNTRTRSLSNMQTPFNDSRRSLTKIGSAGSSGRSSKHARTTSRTSQSDELPVLTPSTPPATRLRGRKVSSPSVSGNSKGKGKQSKGKHVEFNQHPHIVTIEGGPENGDASGEESELTDLEELERSLKAVEPSPRRLRSKDRASSVVSESDTQEKPISVELTPDPNPNRRVVPKRKAKPRIGSLKEEDTEEEDEEVNSAEMDEFEEEDDEVDELASITSSSTTTLDETPRPRRAQKQSLSRPPISTTTSSDGDDEDSDNDGEQAEEEEKNGETLAQPRILRNGKVVGEEEMEIDEAGDYIPDDETITAGSADEEDSTEAEKADVEGEMVDDDGIDLTAATAKTLVRLRRDDLLRLCDEREVEASGTKPQLVAALLQWRDNHSGGFSSPSSTGTIRAPNTVRGARRRTRSAQQTPTTPILERSTHVHMDEPLTPQLSDGHKEAEVEVELDLETLGLDGREIPPEQLQKLEKIGSGGFKDVYVGKWRRRKVAIAEFRGQLTAMDIKELKLLSGFKHDNIVKFLGVSIPENTKETPVMIVSELCSNGDLFDYIRNDKTLPTLRKLIDIKLDIAHGLDYLHNCDPSIIHRDCKSSNILITNKGLAKIADFGLAKVKESTRSLAGSLVGTVNWQAPELWVAHPQYDFKVDVFSCAMVYWEMMQWHLPEKKFPWEGMNEHAIYEVVKGSKDNRPPIDGLAKQWSPGLVDLMKSMWQHSPSARPTMAQVIARLEKLRP